MIDTTVFQNKTAVYYTLGCKLNFSETSTIGKILREAGVRTARKGEKADICVVNTCSVTEMADKKCRQAIHRLVKQHPGAFVVVTGCYAQLKPGDRCREVFIRIREEKQSYAQVAEELGISMNTVDAQLQKAITRLKEMISRAEID